MSDVETGLAGVFSGGRRRVVKDQVDGPQDGTIIRVDTDAQRAYVVMDKSAFSTERRFGPCPYTRGAVHPQVGDKAVVVFIGQGIDRPRIIAYYPA